MKKHWTKLLAVLIVMLIVVTLLPAQRAEAMTIPWTGGSPSCTHDDFTYDYTPIDGSTHDVHFKCKNCSAEAHLTEKHDDSSPVDGTCDLCKGTIAGSSNGSTPASGSTSVSTPAAEPETTAAPVTTPEPTPEPVKHRLLVRYLTIEYDYKSQMPGAYGMDLYEGDTYYVPSPVVEGFTASPPYVTGEMPDHDKTLFVFYTKNAVEEVAVVEESPAPTEPPQQETVAEPTSAPTPASTPVPTPAPTFEIIIREVEENENADALRRACACG